MNMTDPLTPEERELARLLGRPAAALPSSRIDEAILARAREPAASTTAPTPRPSAPPAAFSTGASRSRHVRRRGLVSSLAAAASLVLVVGLAWQLRPTQTPPSPPPVAANAPAPVAEAEMPVPQEANAPIAASDAAAPAPASAPVSEAAPASIARPAPPPARIARAPAGADVAAKVRVQEAAPVALPPPSPARATITPSAPPAPPAPAPAPAAYALEPMPEIAGQAAPSAAAPAALRLHSAATASQVQDGQITMTVDLAQAAADEDARLPRRQWLERIRARRDDGDLDAARASLRRFVRAYPEARIPRDLHPLLAD